MRLCAYAQIIAVLDELPDVDLHSTTKIGRLLRVRLEFVILSLNLP